MAKQVVKNASLLLHSKQLASHVNAIEFTAEAEVKEATNFASDGWKENLQGIRSTNLSCELMLENAEEPEKTLSDLVDNETSVPFTVTMTYPPADGDVALFTQVVSLQITRKLQVGELWSGSMRFGNQGHAQKGVILEYNAGRTATGDSTPLDMGEAVVEGGRLWIAVHVLEVSGTSPTLDLILESDADTGMATPTTRITVPQFTAVGSYITYLAGPVTDEAYQIAATVGGSDTPTFQYVVAIGIEPAS